MERLLQSIKVRLLICTAWVLELLLGDHDSRRENARRAAKVPIHRDEAAKLFLEHCQLATEQLLASITPALRELCKGKHGRPTFDVVKSRRLLTSDAGQSTSKSVERGLLASHCYAITTAIGLDALYGHIDPSSQIDVIERIIYKLIVSEDVGAERVGKPPSPWPRPAPDSNVVAIHAQWTPGTFEGGVPSLQKELIDSYRSSSATEQLVIFLIAVGIMRPGAGVRKAVYQRIDFGSGVVATNQTGTIPLDPKELDEWSDDLQVTDASAALGRFPADIVAAMISAIGTVDQFWPQFGSSHLVTWN